MAAPPPVPQDGGVDDVLDSLRRMLQAGQQDEALEVMRATLELVMTENRRQSEQLRELLRRVYGRSTEKVNPNQLRLALADLRADAAASNAEPAPPPDENLPNDPEPGPGPRGKGKRQGGGRRHLPASLPRNEIRLQPTAEQVAGLGRMWKVDEETSEVLEYVPAHFRVDVYVREIWSNGLGDMVTAPVPNKVIEKGLPGPGLLTQVILAKYKDHTPLARQCRIYARSGVDLHRNTLVDWVASAAFLLEPVAKGIRQRAMAAHVLQVDDTHLKVLDPGRPANVKRGHLWALVGDHKHVAFHYTEDWTAEKAEQFLGGRIGWMQVDGYAGYERMASKGFMLLVACWMHCRRYFVRAFEAGDLRAAVPIEHIRQLYEIERQSKVAGDDHDQRYERRERHMPAILDELEQWIEKHRAIEPPTSLLGKALTYAHNHWKYLRVILADGALELDNGEVERVLRGPAMGRRNWLFAGSDEGAERAAIILTVLETAARHELDLRVYLQDLLQKVADGWPAARLDELLPGGWAGPGAGYLG